jgi:hypothetical protein
MRPWVRLMTAQAVIALALLASAWWYHLALARAAECWR